jgi:hypothetical protein
LVLGNKICQTVGDEIFFSSPYYFRSWQTTRFGKRNLSNCWRRSAGKKNAFAIYMSPSFFFDIKFCFTRLTIQLLHPDSGMHACLGGLVEPSSFGR